MWIDSVILWPIFFERGVTPCSTQGLLLTLHSSAQGTVLNAGIKPWTTAWKSNALSFVLSLTPVMVPLIVRFCLSHLTFFFLASYHIYQWGISILSVFIWVSCRCEGLALLSPWGQVTKCRFPFALRGFCWEGGIRFSYTSSPEHSWHVLCPPLGLRRSWQL